MEESLKERSKTEIRIENKIFSLFIILRRRKLGITQEELSIKSGITRATINALESKGQNSTLVTYNQILNSLGCNISEMMDFSEKVKKNFS